MNKFRVTVNIAQYYYDAMGELHKIPFTNKRHVEVKECEYADAIHHASRLLHHLTKGETLDLKIERFKALKIPSLYQVIANIIDEFYHMSIAIEKLDDDVSITMAVDNKGHVIHFISGKMIVGLHSDTPEADLILMQKAGFLHHIHPAFETYGHPN